MEHLRRLLVGCVVALVLPCCGGRSVAEVTTAGGAETTVASGGSAITDGCVDASEPEGGCGGEAGDPPLSPFAALRTACLGSPTVNRRGAAVPVCYRIR